MTPRARKYRREQRRSQERLYFIVMLLIPYVALFAIFRIAVGILVLWRLIERSFS